MRVPAHSPSAVALVVGLLLLTATACNAALPRYTPPNDPPADASADAGSPKGLLVPDSTQLKSADQVQAMEFREIRHHLHVRHRDCDRCSYETSRQRLVDAIEHGAPVYDEQRRREIETKKATLRERSKLSDEHAKRAHEEILAHNLAEIKRKHPQLAHLHNHVYEHDASWAAKIIRQHRVHGMSRFDAETAAITEIAEARQQHAKEQDAVRNPQRQEADEL